MRELTRDLPVTQFLTRNDPVYSRPGDPRGYDNSRSSNSAGEFGFSMTTWPFSRKDPCVRANGVKILTIVIRTHGPRLRVRNFTRVDWLSVQKRVEIKIFIFSVTDLFSLRFSFPKYFLCLNCECELLPRHNEHMRTIFEWWMGKRWRHHHFFSSRWQDIHEHEMRGGEKSLSIQESERWPKFRANPRKISLTGDESDLGKMTCEDSWKGLRAGPDVNINENNG